VLRIDESAFTEEAKLDGCYVLKSDLAEQSATKETIHDRYKDLTLVESAFRSSKTVNLELRPIHVRLASRTRGHVFCGDDGVSNHSRACGEMAAFGYDG